MYLGGHRRWVPLKKFDCTFPLAVNDNLFIQKNIFTQQNPGNSNSAGKRKTVQFSGEFELFEFESSRFYCTYLIRQVLGVHFVISMYVLSFAVFCSLQFEMHTFFNKTNLQQIVFTVTNKKINLKRSIGRSQENECYKRLIHKQFVQVSGLCGPQLQSYLPKRFTHLCRALYTYGVAILVYRFGAPIWPPEINKNIWSSLFL